MPQCSRQFWNLSQTIMSGSLCNSFGSLSAGVHERSRKWCARQKLRTKITFVPLWLFDQVKQSGELLSPCAALPSLPLEETPPLWFVSHSDGVHQTPQNSKSLKNVAPLKKRSCQAIFSFSMAALFLISAILLLFYVSRRVSFLVLIITLTGGAANILEIITKFLGSLSISTFTQVSQSSKIEADI